MQVDDKTGRVVGTHKTYAVCGFIRGMVSSFFLSFSFSLLKGWVKIPINYSVIYYFSPFRMSSNSRVSTFGFWGGGGGGGGGFRVVSRARRSLPPSERLARETRFRDLKW